MERTAYITPQVLVDVNHCEFMEISRHVTFICKRIAMDVMMVRDRSEHRGSRLTRFVRKKHSVPSSAFKRLGTLGIAIPT